MRKKAIRLFAIVFACYAFIAVGSCVNAQSVQPKITATENNAGLLGTSISVKGEASPNSNIVVSIRDEKDIFAYSMKTAADVHGNWSADFDQSLKSGKYYVLATEQNGSGLSLGQAQYGPIVVRGSFAFIVEIFSILVVILLAGFVGGWYINRMAEVKRFRRILISQRDIIAAYNVLKKDADKALKDISGYSSEEAKNSEIAFLLKRISDNLEKMNKYVVKGVSVIGEYNIITKIEDKLKLKP